MNNPFLEPVLILIFEIRVFFSIFVIQDYTSNKKKTRNLTLSSVFLPIFFQKSKIREKKHEFKKKSFLDLKIEK